MKKILIVFIAALGIVGVLLAPATVSAQTVQEARCTIAKARIELRQTTSANAETARTTAYNSIVTRLETISGTAEATTFDTTTLVSGIGMVKEAIAGYTTASSEYKASLTALAASACGDSTATFTTDLTEARAALVVLRTTAQQVRTTYTENVKPALQAYATFLAAPAAGEEQL